MPSSFFLRNHPGFYRFSFSSLKVSWSPLISLSQNASPPSRTAQGYFPRLFLIQFASSLSIARDTPPRGLGSARSAHGLLRIPRSPSPSYSSFPAKKVLPLFYSRGRRALRYARAGSRRCPTCLFLNNSKSGSFCPFSLF